MIKIQLTTRKRRILENLHRDGLNHISYSLLPRLTNLLNIPRFTDPRTIAVTNYIIQNLDDVLHGNRDRLIAIKDQWELLIQLVPEVVGNQLRTEYKNYLLDNIFRYDHFSKYKATIYCAHNLADTLKLGTCVYCNRQYTSSWVRADSRARCQFDHFVPKKEFPLFALSLYNLIPSCALCNCYEKKTSDFDFRNNFHPYFDCGDDVFRFRIVSRDGNEIVDPLFWFGEGAEDRFMIKIIPQVGVDEQDDDYQRFLSNQRVLQTQNYYNQHKDYALEIIRKAHFYPKFYTDTLREIMKEFNFVTIKLKEFYVGNYLLTEDFHKRTLSKLTKDIAEQYCLL